MQRNNDDCDFVLRYFLESLDSFTLKDLYLRAPYPVREVLDSEETLALLSSKTGRKEDSFLKFMTFKKERALTSKNCSARNATDVCMRKASEENQGGLVELFMTEGATDVFGALVKAAENGADDAIMALSPHCTVKMFDIAAAHAAYGGHRELMIELYSSGTESQATRNSILQMAIRGGQYECAKYILGKKAKLTEFELNLLGKNLEQMVLLFRGITLRLNPCSIASFGGPEDYHFALKYDPALFDVDPFQILVCALENGNEYFSSLFAKKVTVDANEGGVSYQRLYQAACVGGIERFILKYAKRADRLLSGMYVVIASGKVELLQKLLAIKKLSIEKAPIYAGYSGSSDMVSFVVKEESIEKTRMLATGAAAGGNFDQLKNYIIALGDAAEYTRYFAEALRFSRYNLFEELYSYCKDLFPAQEVRNHLEKALKTKSLLTALPRGETHPMLLERVDEILG